MALAEQSLETVHIPLRMATNRKDGEMERNAQETKLQAAENDLNELMADVTRAMEKAQEAVAKIAFFLSFTDIHHWCPTPGPLEGPGGTRHRCLDTRDDRLNLEADQNWTLARPLQNDRRCVDTAAFAALS